METQPPSSSHEVQTNFLAGTTSSFTSNGLDTHQHRESSLHCQRQAGRRKLGRPHHFYEVSCSMLSSSPAPTFRDTVFCFEWRHTILLLLVIFDCSHSALLHFQQRSPGEAFRHFHTGSVMVSNDTSRLQSLFSISFHGSPDLASVFHDATRNLPLEALAGLPASPPDDCGRPHTLRPEMEPSRFSRMEHDLEYWYEDLQVGESRMTDLMRLEHSFCRRTPRADLPHASIGFARQAMNLAPIWAEEQGFHADLAASEAALHVHAKPHQSPERQQHNALFTTIEAFGALLLELDVELSPVKIIHHPDLGSRSTMAAAHRLRAIGVGAVRVDRIFAAQVSPRRSLAHHPGIGPQSVDTNTSTEMISKAWNKVRACSS